MSPNKIADRPLSTAIPPSVRPDVSVVIYVNDFLENASQMYAYVANYLKEENKTFEFIFMDDGSNKEIHTSIEGIHEFVKNTKVIRFPRPCGT